MAFTFHLNGHHWSNDLSSIAVTVGTDSQRTIPTIRPLRGMTLPKVAELMRVPRTANVSDSLLQLAYETLDNFFDESGVNSPWPLMPYEDKVHNYRQEHQQAIENFGYDDYNLGTSLRNFRAARKEYVMLAVHKMLQYHAPKRFLKLLTKVGETSPRGNAIYKLERDLHDIDEGFELHEDNPFTSYYLVYTCPSTKKLYITGVPDTYGAGSRVRPADSAMAWVLQLTLPQYDKLKVEA